MLRSLSSDVLALLVAATAWACASVESGAQAPAESGGGKPGAAVKTGVAAVPASKLTPRGAPATPPRGWLKGQTHVHTDRSHDANTPPERVLEFYAARGYDFISLTDHNRVTVVQAPKGLLLLPGVELTQNSKMCEPKPTLGYRCLIHTTALFVDPAKDPAKGKKIRFPYVENRRSAYLAQMKLAQKWGGITVLNHPLFHFAANARTVRSLEKSGLRLIELVNAGLDQQHPKGRSAAEDRAEALWDEALTAGARVYALATDDAHHFDDEAERKKLGKFAYTGDRAWVHVRARKEAADIRRALLAGDFYASTGVRLAEIEASPDNLRVIVAEPKTCQIRFIGPQGKQVGKGSCPEASMRPPKSLAYVRATVVGADGKKAWVQPVFPGGG